MANDTREIPQLGLQKLQAWLDQNGLQGYDPYDALSNPVLAALGKASNLAGRVAIQSLLYLPFNVRPLMGIKKAYDAKALGLMGRGYFLIWDRTRRSEDWEKGMACLRVLDTLRISGFSGECWGHPFPYRSRRGYLPANRPSIVSTYYAAQAYLDAYERSGEAKFLEIARSSCNFILKDLDRIGEKEKFCFSYLADGNLAIHNANLLAVQLIARVARLARQPAMIEEVRPALEYTLDDQNPDGSWFYDGPHSISRHDTFIDGFHTGFVLESLWDVMNDTGWDLRAPIRRGLDYYLANLFAPDGRPFRMVQHPWPVDLRDCAQAIIVLSKLSDGFDNSIQTMRDAVARWTIKHTQTDAGYFYFRRSPRWVTFVPYLRFQAWMLASLATLAKILQK